MDQDQQLNVADFRKFQLFFFNVRFQGGVTVRRV